MRRILVLISRSGGMMTQNEPGRPPISVVGAAIHRNGRVLCARRGDGKSLSGLWEFPGGKIEAGETARQALHREIEEELLCEIEVDEQICMTLYHYDFGSIRLATFLCRLLSGTPHLTEHQEVRWLTPAEMTSLDWAPADREAVGILNGRSFDSIHAAATSQQANR